MAGSDANPCSLCEVARACRAGSHPALIAELRESFCILGENQGCLGWCVLVLKEHVEHLAELPVARQETLWSDVARVTAAQRGVFGPIRINYECLGNVVPHIHWHLIPRHANDPEPRSPVWGWPAATLKGDRSAEERSALAAKIRAALT